MSDYELQQKMKTHVLVCTACSGWIDPARDGSRCHQDGSEGEWQLTCGRCEEIIDEQEEAFERDRGRYYVCKSCHESGDA